MDDAPSPASGARADGSLRSRYGPWAVVTGASAGIGRAMAVQLAEEGLSLVLVARRGELLAELARDLAERHGVEARALALDLAREESVRRLAEATRELDVGLFVAAAGFGYAGSSLAADPRVQAEMVDVNCRALLLSSLELGRRFAERGRGGLVLWSSLVGFQGTPFAATYAATKAFVQSLAEALHVELAPRGVDVIAAAPGPVHTEFAARAGMTMRFALQPDVVARATLAALGRRGTVRPGWLSKLLGASLRILPRGMRVRAIGRGMERMAVAQPRGPERSA